MSFMEIARIALRLLQALVRLIVPIVLFLLRLPWILLGAAPGIVVRVRGFSLLPARLRAATADTAVCRRCGHETSLLSRYRCPVCKSIETTHAWAPCSTCRTRHPAGYVACANPDCGEAIPNPLLGGAS